MSIETSGHVDDLTRPKFFLDSEFVDCFLAAVMLVDKITESESPDITLCAWPRPAGGLFIRLTQ